MEVDKVKKELKRQYDLVPREGKDWVSFLRAMNIYLAYIKHQPLLTKIILSIREENVRRRIEEAQESLESVYTDDHYNMMAQAEAEHEVESKGNWFPQHRYVELLRADAEFEKVKHLNTEEEISNAMIVIEEVSPATTVTRKVHGYGLLRLAEYGYSKYIEELHLSLLNELDKVEKKGTLTKYLHYDPVYSIFYFKDKEIKINLKKRVTNSHYLLSYLLNNNPFEKHFYDELEDAEVLLESKSWTSYYDACEDIQTKVMKATGIEDFLDYNSGGKMYVRVNSKYSLHKT